MPSLILSGKPCRGKTTFAKLLAQRALLHGGGPSGQKISNITNVIHITDATACPDMTKAECYLNSQNEKILRGALKSEFDRAVMSVASVDGSSKGGRGSTLVILDSLNYIKGFRYELHCISKAAGERHGVIWIMGGEDDGSSGSSTCNELAKLRNRERRERMEKSAISVSDGYFEDDAIMDELSNRYEAPDAKNRWDSPLYKVNMAQILPWGNEGSSDVHSKPSKIMVADSNNTNNTHESSLQNQMGAIDIDYASDNNQKSEIKPAASTKPTKSSSGFRRNKRSLKSFAATKGSEASANAKDVAAAPTAEQVATRSTTDTTDTSNTINELKKMEDVIDEILDSFLIDVQPLKEGMSTLKHVSAESNVLNQVDNLTHTINNQILKAQNLSPIPAGVGGKIFITFPKSNEKRPMQLAKPIYTSELRNIRRKFLKWIGSHPLPDGTGEDELMEVYISYIESQI